MQKNLEIFLNRLFILKNSELQKKPAEMMGGLNIWRRIWIEIVRCTNPGRIIATDLGKVNFCAGSREQYRFLCRFVHFGKPKDSGEPC